ncbi:MAG: hypothetical protein WCD08_06425 [Steroidobacteraceae bacterium]
MIDRKRAAVSGLPPVGEWLFAVVFWSAALAIMALALSMLPLPDEKLPAPRWLIGVTALLFIAAGFAPRATRWGASSWKTRAVGAGVLWPLAIVLNYIAFGSGGRTFSSSVAVAGSVVQRGVMPESGGRVLFACFAVALDVWVLVIAVKWLRRK